MNDGTAPQITRKTKIKKWIIQHRLSIIIISGAVIATVGFLITIYSTEPAPQVSVPKVKPKVAEKYYSPLTGSQVDSLESTKQAVTAVMIENSPDARPQSGLKQAGVVYETVAEGGITRFIAIYQQEKPQVVGPVRSLRIYYLDWAVPYQASIVHFGGSYNALSEVGNGNYRDLDLPQHSDSHWRAGDRVAPHNAYTSFEKLDAVNSRQGYKTSEFTSFKRTDGKPAKEPDATSINVNFSSDTFNTSYTYNAELNNYSRNLAGEPHHDREEGQITPSVVVVLKVGTQSRGGPDGYEDIITTGEGQAYIFQNGTIREVIWQKGDRSEPLRLVDGEGKDISLIRGQTWIGAITERGSVSWQ